MNAPVSRFSKNICTVAVIFAVSVFYFGCRNVQTQNNNFPTLKLQKSSGDRKWIPTGYAGIEIGKSTRNDVINKFGKPVWEGEEELEGEEEDVQEAIASHSGKRILLEYKDVGELEGRTSIFIGEQNKIVQAIALYL
jgi:hypothetical protein